MTRIKLYTYPKLLAAIWAMIPAKIAIIELLKVTFEKIVLNIWSFSPRLIHVHIMKGIECY